MAIKKKILLIVEAMGGSVCTYIVDLEKELVFSVHYRVRNNAATREAVAA